MELGLAVRFSSREVPGRRHPGGALALATRYTGAPPLAPYLEIRANVLGGDADPTDRTLNTYNPMFPSAEFYGDIGLVGPSNLVSIRANFGVTLPGDVSVGGATTVYWRQSAGDGNYGTALNLQRPDGGSDARYTGAQGDVLLAWTASRHIGFRGVYSIFMPGRFIQDTGPAKAVHFILLQSLFTF